MSAGLVAVLLVAAVLLCVAIGGLVWWVRRPLPTDRSYSRQTLPLFSNDLMIDAAPIIDEELDGDDEPVRRDENVVVAGRSPSAEAVAAALGDQSTSAERRALRFAPPPGASPVTSIEAPRPPERTVEAELDMPRPAPAPARAPLSPPPAVGWNARATPAAPTFPSQRAAFQPQRTTAVQTPPSNPALNETATSGDTFEGKSLRFSVPTDGTLQFLPGRLEITAGKDLGREIRFVRVPGINIPRVTFGRVDGPMYRHVQLHDQTVSRKHAVMELEGAEWTLTNLSTTNPVVLNERLLGEGETLTLSDGDRIEMGEVVFRYRVR